MPLFTPSSTTIPSTTRPTLLTRFYTFYLSLAFPWRRQILAGTDLQNNKYFYLRLPSSSPSSSSQSPRNPSSPQQPRHRRILRPATGSARGSLATYATVSDTIPPQWHQWLRYTRADPPTWDELLADERRKQDLKVLARRADERWAALGTATATAMARPPVMEAPGQVLREELGTGGEVAGTSGSGRRSRDNVAADNEGKDREPGTERGIEAERRKKGSPGQTWQPESWTPR